MTVIHLSEIAPSSTWAVKHLEFVRAGAEQIVSHLRTMSNKQFAVEFAEVQALKGQQYISPPDSFLIDLYYLESRRRPGMQIPTPANQRFRAADADTDQIPF